MDRLACVEIPALPLQMLLRGHPAWGGLPVAVVDEDKPQGRLLWVNEPAFQKGVRPGQRYAGALALAEDLRAGVVAPAAIVKEVDLVVERLRLRAPGVEPCAGEPGVFWLDARGLGQIYPSLASWAKEIREDLGVVGLTAGVVVGTRRFACYALVKTLAGARVVVCEGDKEETAALRVPLARVGLEPEARAALEQLGIRTVGDFIKLPPAGILRRYGAEAHRLHRMAAGDLTPPLDPRPPIEPVAAVLDLDDRESDVTRLLFLMKQLIDRLLPVLAKRGEALAELLIRLGPGGPHEALPSGGAASARSRPVEEIVKPAEPTLDAVQLLGLVRLRLETLQLREGVERIAVTATGVPARAEQLLLFSSPQPKRDPQAAARAFARLRAAFGDGAVVRARLTAGHLPEATFSWEPIGALTPPSPREVPRRTLVRRILARPEPLPPRPPQEPDGWLIRGLEHGPVARLTGPYLISGGWWRPAATSEVARDYYFAELQNGEFLWVYFDRGRRRWFLQGEVG